jgi:hypothetical protein
MAGSGALPAAVLSAIQLGLGDVGTASPRDDFAWDGRLSVQVLGLGEELFEFTTGPGRARKISCSGKVIR